MNKWSDYFKIVELDGMTKSNNFWEETEYQLMDPDGKVIATYKDFKYAKKQAKYRFKKLQKRVENILLK